MSPKPKRHFSRWQKIVALLLIIGGLFLLTLFGWRLLRHAPYLRGDLQMGTTAVENIQPWMTLQYIAVAYSVPTPYLANALGIADTPRHRNMALGQLARQQEIEGSAFIGLAQEAIRTYQANPVPTGLTETRPWMTLDYIANGTGIPLRYLLENLHLPQDENLEYLPLRQLRRVPEQKTDDLEERLAELIQTYDPDLPAGP